MFKLSPAWKQPPRIDVKFPILGFLMESAMTGYDLKRLFRDSVGFYYRASDGSLYPALKKLARQGLLTMRTERKGGRTRNVYAITAVGRAWFLKALAAPSPPVFVHEEAAVKLFFARHQPEVGLKHLIGMREKNDEMAEYIASLKSEFESETDPFRRVVMEVGKRTIEFRSRMLAELITVLEKRLGDCSEASAKRTGGRATASGR